MKRVWMTKVSVFLLFFAVSCMAVLHLQAAGDSGEADQETVYLREGALFRESGFGYGKPCGYGAVKAGQSSDPAPYHVPVMKTECPEF